MTIRRLTAVLTTAALASGAGLGVAQAARTNADGASSAPARQGHRGPDQAGLEPLADALGVTVEQLRAALEATPPPSRTARRATAARGSRPTSPRR